MAIVTLNQMLDVIRGGVGKLVMRRRPDGTLILSGAPIYRKGKGSPKQKAHRQRVKEAAQYAKWADDVYPIYTKLAKGSEKWLSPYNVALSDWFHPPVIHRIEQRDGHILVQASDNILVTKVLVTVFDESGTILEGGDATRGEADTWQFASNKQGKTIVAEAWDLPGNVARLELM
jgi:hypothetical protein